MPPPRNLDIIVMKVLDQYGEMTRKELFKEVKKRVNDPVGSTTVYEAIKKLIGAGRIHAYKDTSVKGRGRKPFIYSIAEHDERFLIKAGQDKVEEV